MSQFADPAAPSSGITWGDFQGALLLITVNGVESGIQTQFGEADAVRADVAVLDGPKAGEEYNDTLVFPKVMSSQLRSQAGKQVVGRLGQGQAKKGQSPPWMLSAATDEDKALAGRFIASRMGAPAQAPQQQQPTPQAQPQQQPAAQQWQQGQQPAAQSGQTVPF